MPEQRALRAERLSFSGLTALHLLPGALGTIAYILLAEPIASIGYPPLAALLVAVGAVILPLELTILYLVRASRLAARREPLPVRTWPWLVPALLAAAVAGSVVVAPAAAVVAQTVFGWLPGWYLRPIGLDSVSNYSASAWAVTLGAYLVLNGLAAPVVEELYFRGWLLPRMARFGRWAPLLNAVLFSVYHFWTPWQFLSRVVALAPFTYAVWWRRNVRLGMAVHVLLNTLGGLIVVAAIAGRL